MTFRYSIANLISALAVVSYHLQEITEYCSQVLIMRGYALLIKSICITNIVIQLTGKIPAVTSSIPSELVAIIFRLACRNLRKK